MAQIFWALLDVTELMGTRVPTCAQLFLPGNRTTFSDISSAVYPKPFRFIGLYDFLRLCPSKHCLL